MREKVIKHQRQAKVFLPYLWHPFGIPTNSTCVWGTVGGLASGINYMGSPPSFRTERFSFFSSSNSLG